MDRIIDATDEEKVFQAVIDEIKKTCEKDILSYNRSAAIDKNTDLKLDLDLDSISLVVLQINIEDSFGILFDPLHDDFDEIFCTSGSVYRFVLEKLKEKNL